MGPVGAGVGDAGRAGPRELGRCGVSNGRGEKLGRGCGPRGGKKRGERRPGPRGRKDWAGRRWAWAGLGPGGFIFSISFLFLNNSNLFEFKRKFEFKLLCKPTNKTMHQHECNTKI